MTIVITDKALDGSYEDESKKLRDHGVIVHTVGWSDVSCYFQYVFKRFNGVSIDRFVTASYVYIGLVHFNTYCLKIWFEEPIFSKQDSICLLKIMPIRLMLTIRSKCQTNRIFSKDSKQSKSCMVLVL